jgi:DNA-binding NarL/FixJ family response regulator
MPDAAKIIIVDDHPISRYGVAALINMQPNMEISAEAGTARDGLEAISKFGCDLALLDLNLPDSNGLEVIKDAIALRPELKILVLSMHDESLYAERALRAGARGYIMKESAPESLISAIQSVLDGGVYLSSAMSSRLLEMLSGQKQGLKSPLERLTDREIEVFEFIGNGIGSRQIAEKLSLSIRTIDAHRANIREKLGLRDGNELVRNAVRWVESGGKSN